MQRTNAPVDPTARDPEDDFLARGLIAARESREQNLYVDSQDVIAKLEAKLLAAKSKTRGMDCGSSPQCG